MSDWMSQWLKNDHFGTCKHCGREELLWHFDVTMARKDGGYVPIGVSRIGVCRDCAPYERNCWGMMDEDYFHKERQN